MHDENQSLARSSELFRSIWRIQQSIRSFAQKTAIDNNLSIPQYALLMMLAPKREITQKKLGNIMKFPKSTLSQAVDGLVQANLIKRHPVEDNRREMQLILTDNGKQLYEKLKWQEGSIHQVLELAIASLNENQFEEAVSTLLQIAVFLEKESEKLGE
ncbi:MarR family transcriptional regulator [Bacillus sp. Bva_UNVM-123]|uniref:MarR family winged helix-turn-helix transcriptional regulator n=1 Tax=Bacillus sp. Bva_UNVM-123 TaxID=2829798 RepID=UPI00391F5061